MASTLDCCGRCEIEEDPEDTKFGGYVDACTRCEGAGGVSAVDGSQVLQGVGGHERLQAGTDQDDPRQDTVSGER